MGIENITLINTDSFILGVREVIIGVIAGVITIIIGYYLIEKRRERRQIKQEEENKQMERKEQEEANQREKLEQERDKKRIYDWLYDKTKHLIPNTVGSPFDTITWPSTMEISSAIDLTEERVRYICTIDKRIQRQEKSDLWPNQELEERWTVRKFVRN